MWLGDTLLKFTVDEERNSTEIYLCGNVEVSSSNDTSAAGKDYVKLIVCNENLRAMQTSDYAVNGLKNKISRNIPVDRWNCGALNQFKWQRNSIKWKNELVYNDENGDFNGGDCIIYVSS